ncbi:MAG TPA: hydantoinase B/oxoprolinase family protein [Chloroflexota bacterium]|nr:hydantoinase B/oxoprolinase family protein [Chloroflexota bacterium]
MASSDQATRTVDPVTFEILSHRLHQITKEMGTTLERVGGTVNTTQMHDYMSALYRANGDVLSPGDSTGFHVACAGFAVKRIIERFADDVGIAPGDMFLLNDPYLAAIHQSDVYLISPIHYADQLVGWSATFVHVMDIGAMSPGGNSPGATEICHEGVRIPGIKLIERGKLRQDVFDAITNMTRQPVMVGLDLKCEIAANNVARSRMQEMCDEFGWELVDAVSLDMIRYSEQVLRRRLSEIPDGTWTAEGVIQTSDTWRVKLSLRKRGDSLVFDFTGTDPQARVGINLPYHATFGTCFGSLVALLGWDIPKNHGAFAPIEVIAPPGTIVNPQYPAPVSLNTTSGGAVARFLADSVLTQMIATSEKWRAEVGGKSLGHRLMRHAAENQYGRYYVSTLTSLDGGGATAATDGTDSGGRSNMTAHNIEWVELNFPLLHLFNRHIKDGAGAGMLRGGAGVEYAFVLHDAPQGRVKGVALGVAGLRNSGQGVFGGYPGAPSLLLLQEGTRVREMLDRDEWPTDPAALGGESRQLPYCDFEIKPDDVLIMIAASGGGYGDPLDRDPELVLQDVEKLLVSEEMARTVYGVVIVEHHVDRAGTEMMRSRLREERTEHAVAPSRAGHRPSPGADLRYSHPLREHLEVWDGPSGSWVRCDGCGHLFGPVDEDWTDSASRSRRDPTMAGPRMASLTGQYLVEQLTCPSCGVLLNTDVIDLERGA